MSSTAQQRLPVHARRTGRETAAKQRALDEFVTAAMAIATRYGTDVAQRSDAPRETFVEPGTGIERENGFTVPVILLNSLQRAARAVSGLFLVSPVAASPRSGAAVTNRAEIEALFAHDSRHRAKVGVMHFSYCPFCGQSLKTGA